MRGYTDNGMDDWMDEDADGSEEEVRTNKKSA